ncbi:YgiQ family radical SAM protein [Flavilitoribacter nigricans]|uniref:YgiQ family radical SAM protein n=1 Tax=Flavilitoribacter nigricans (strain ATCC 23147 / DSM 23189 / NBRC 102662 / NCIMB 1420 / SS-2) TaxID=1122177 RepID=A0A2D0NAR1_FLAN2|nr:YgiQ family radical SAM protein [Flavilitoribacter nigricans]PHN05468.1 YgiQ family radical SAM protein [Flavilitoribacter nigricans DSM 23189 = NBRC 102662]
MFDDRPLSDWLPITAKEVEARGWEELDVILISGDSYVDHPAFGTAVIGRILESEGLRIAIVPQPNWQDDLRDFKKLGKPRLFFGVTSGCMDSMVNHYTAARRRRSTDAYTAGGEAGFRPDYATTVYTKALKKLFPDVPVLIGGIEASLRRVTHYDYWEDKLFPNILTMSGADMLVYGMGELPLREIVRLLKRGVPFENLTTIPQTAVLTPRHEELPVNKNWEDFILSSHERCLRDKRSYAANFKHIEQESNKVNARRLIQGVGDHNLIVNPPYPPMSEEQIDSSFDLPYTRLPHPKYKKRGSIPAYEMIRFSVNMHRGCFGGCSFCTISAHQGKFIASRSEESILKEVDKVTKMPDFKGYISDLGGPSANMYRMKGKVQEICDRCVSPSCIHPVICSNLDTSHKPMTELYRKVDAHPEVKKAFVGSGIRYDLLVDSYNKNNDGSLDEYMEQVVTCHISGRLKVAPEHTSDNTLRVMRKPSFKHFHEFKKKYDYYNKKHGLDQPLIPYFISSHPGSQAEDMANLAAETKDMGFKLEQVQDFTPTPMTVATVIYHTGLHPYTLKPVYTAKSEKEKKKQHMFFFWHKRENHQQIRDQLKSLGREDLIEKLIGDKKKYQKQEAIKTRSKGREKFNSRRQKKRRKK